MDGLYRRLYDLQYADQSTAPGGDGALPETISQDGTVTGGDGADSLPAGGNGSVRSDES
jgi:hypothetical protein